MKEFMGNPSVTEQSSSMDCWLKIEDALNNLADEVLVNAGRKLVGLLPRPRLDNLIDLRQQLIERENSIARLPRQELLAEVKRLAKEAIKHGKTGEEVLSVIAKSIEQEGDLDYLQTEAKEVVR